MHPVTKRNVGKNDIVVYTLGCSGGVKLGLDWLWKNLDRLVLVEGLCSGGRTWG